MKQTPTSRTILIFIVILALAVIAAVFLTHHADKGVVQNQVPETTTVPPAPAQWPSTKVQDQTVTDNSSYYTIKAVYPITKDDVITGYFKSFVDSTITQFKQDTSWAANGSSGADAEAGSLSLTISYTEQKNSNADNYIFSIDTYTGGAHDLEATKTFSFSATGQQITLDTLFTNGMAGLATIVPYVKAKLATQPYADQSMIDDGTTPTADNYQSFTVSDDSITFIFDPYQVASYAAGQQTVTIPVSVFATIANPDLFKTTTQ